MESKHQSHNLIILDESGSMQTIREPVIEMFNGIVTAAREVASKYPEHEQYVTFVTFNTLGIKEYMHMKPLRSLDFISGQNYRPAAMTPLYDTMGISLSRLRNHIGNLKDYNVLVNILTDGLENASKEYSGAAVMNLINDLKGTGKWTFAYAGADHDVYEAARNMNISNSVAFDKSASGLNFLMEKEIRSRHMLHKKIRTKRDITDDYYKDSQN